MNKKFKSILGSAIAVLMLASCGGKGNTSVSRPSGNGGEDVDPSTLKYKPAEGIYNFTTATPKEKAEILGQLEGYAMNHHLAGIPLYDDAGYELFSPRIKLASDKYIPNYGFGVGNSTLDPSGKMYGDSAILTEADTPYPSYFQSYATEDSGTFNYWNSQGQDVAGKNGMITASYYGVTMNKSADGYYWRGELARGDDPIPLDDNGKEVTYEDGMVSRFWRIPLYTAANAPAGRKFVYSTAPESKWYTKYNGREIVLDDYLTPFQVMLDNALVRASGLIDDASGFAGASDYLYASGQNKKWGETKYSKPTNDHSYFNGVGIKLNTTENSIDVAFITPQSRFYARYNTASGLYSPMPADFLKDIGNGSLTTGAKNFGMIGSNADPKKNCDNILSCGAYNVISWEQTKLTVYEKNPTYNMVDEIHFEGYCETGFKDEDQAFESFLQGKLDEASVPSKRVKDFATDKMAHKTEGSTVIKINVNSCTQSQWDRYFGTNGTAYQHTNPKTFWDVKPIMSNDDFLDGVYFSMNRAELANKTGHNPAYGYLSGAYKIDPENDLSFRDTDEGKAVTAKYEKVADGGIPGYSPSMAQQLFKKAIQTLVANGDYEDDDKITLTFWWRKDEALQNIGKTLESYIETPFNAAAKELGYDMTLDIDCKVAGSSYTDAYSKMDQGEFDFAEGAITGNVLNPISFMSVICTNKLSQGFTTNWGDDTAKLTAKPCEFKELSWSYDALYTAANGAAIVKKGVNVNPINDWKYSEDDDENLVVNKNDGTFTVYFETPDVVDKDGESLVKYGINYVWLQFGEGSQVAPYYFDYTSALGSANLQWDYNKNDGSISFTMKSAAIKNSAKQIDGSWDAGNVDTLVFEVGFKCEFTGVEKTVVGEAKIPLAAINASI
ncbi:MAG: ABC transporter substrate-binding protein [Bacilli bacterium]|nr:ABC transporter substrate-binding protein [Bacilli bacterium]